jgi:hypothetical protein
MGNTPPRDTAFNNTFNQKYILNTAANSFGSVLATVATGGPRFKENHIFTDFLELERDLLPSELFVLILSFVELKTICIVISQVCKALFNEVSANSTFWQAKVKAEKPVQQKRDEQTWKQFYLIGKRLRSISEYLIDFTYYFIRIRQVISGIRARDCHIHNRRCFGNSRHRNHDGKPY